MKSYIRYIFVVMAMAMSFVASAETADGILKKAAAAVNGAEGLTASFTLDYGKQKVSGTLKASGKKFTIQTPASSTWFDGRTMWTYNPRTNETTVMTPTAQELTEANPLSIVNTYSTTFTAAFSKSQSRGSQTIVLTPKSKQTGYKSVHVTIPDGSKFPSQLVVIPASGQKVTVSITKASTGPKPADSEFTYPKPKYPKAEIIDLR